MGIIASFRERMSQPLFYEGLRDRILPRVDRGELPLDTPLSSIADSLDLVELMLGLEEMKIEVDVPIKTVGDFLWLVKKIEFRKARTGSSD
jgi:acyl carrier protein